MRPLIIGENNPQSLQPGHELYPLPDGCAGNRLWHMLDDAHKRRHGAFLRPTLYLRSFERRNLVVARTFDAKKARAVAGMIAKELFGSNRTVLLLGRRVQHAFNAPPAEPFSEWQNGGVRFWRVPHPSGRNLWYNDPRNQEMVGDFLLKLYEESK